ncbi:MAG: hypothetical protein K8T26_14640 [Lentisphaerae bacterium]|nr:hypothetical protein [Lentisphaerota bacterium]
MQTGLAAGIGVALIAIWVAFLFEGREEMRRSERLSYDFVFKWNILPLLVALELFTTHSLAVLGVGAMAFVLCWPIAKYSLAAMPVITGWHVGTQWFSKIYAQSDQRVFMGAVIVAITMTLVCQAIVAAMRRPPAHT